MRSVILTLFIISVTLAPSTLSEQTQRKIPLSSVDSLTFIANKYTTARRSSPIPQLTCVTPKICNSFRPSNVLCRNVGSDGVDVQWHCEADLPDNMRFSSIEVSCEGFDWPQDP